MESFGKRIWQLRKSGKLSQLQLAERIGIGPKFLGKIEAGTIFPKESSLIKFAEALNADLLELQIQYFSDKIAQELHKNNCSAIALDVARVKLNYLHKYYPRAKDEF